MKRREFHRLAIGTVGACAIPALGREPIGRRGPARFSIGLAAYSFRDYFAYMKGKVKEPRSDGKPMNMTAFLDYCVQHRFDGAELTSYFFKPDADDKYFVDLKQQAFVRGLSICGTAIGNDFTVGEGPKLDQQVADAQRWIDKAALLGAPHIRFFAGTGGKLAAHPERLDEAVEAIHRCAEHAAGKGIFLGIENHGRLSSDQMLMMMDKVKSPWVGINLDSGNFISDDPYKDLERCAPYAVNVQLKTQMKRPDGSLYPADFVRVAEILKKSNYQGNVVLEFEESNPYGGVPEALARMRKVFI